MRYDLCVYWVEDSKHWLESVMDLIQTYVDDDGVAVQFVTECNGDIAYSEIEKSGNGFKKYDLFFVDLNVSSSISGSDIIKMIRQNNIDVDILFYSANKETEIQKTIQDNLSAYEGVYVANRNTFHEKALQLILKNARKLMSIMNIRGKLMDCTSENDFVISSYIINKYPQLSPPQQQALVGEIQKYIRETVLPNAEKIEKFEEDVQEQGIKNINRFMRKSSVLVPLELKYLIFNKISEYCGENPARFSGYFDQIVGKRNILAHKKLELCDNLDHIKYCDTYEQLQRRQCPVNCTSCKNEFTISVEDWKDIRKKTNLFSQIFDTMLEKLDKKS